MPTVIKGQPTSKELIKMLKQKHPKVCLSFSCGKDSIACWLWLRENGIEVVPVYFYYVPNLDFINKELAYFEEYFNCKIHRYPHPSLLNNMFDGTWQSPSNIKTLLDFGIYKTDYAAMWDGIKQDLDLPENMIVCDGVRAADSIVRRASFVKHGVYKPHLHKCSPIADFLKQEVIDIIEKHHVKLPIDYEIMARSFDGYDYRFTKPIRDNFPADYERIKEFFPLLDYDIKRREHFDFETTSKKGANYTERAKNEQKRFKNAIDAAFYLLISFERKEHLDKIKEHFKIDDSVFDADFEKMLIDAGFNINTKKSFSKGLRPMVKVGKDFTKDIEYTDNLEQDFILEFDSLKEHFKGYKPKDKENFFTSPWFFGVIFKSYDDQVAFIKKYGLYKYGTFILNGSKIFKSILS